MHKRLGDVTDEIKEAERRLVTLAAHLGHAENHKKHRAVFLKWKGLSGKKADAFYAKHGEHIRLFEDSKRHFDSVMNGRKDLPIRDWEVEQKGLLAKRYGLLDEFYSLREDVRSVETVQRSLEGVMRESVEQDLSARKTKAADR